MTRLVEIDEMVSGKKFGAVRHTGAELRTEISTSRQSPPFISFHLFVTIAFGVSMV